MSEHANEVRGEILINNFKPENKWKFLLTGVNFYKHQSKQINRNIERKNKTQEEKKKREKRKRTQKGKKRTGT